MTDTRIYQCSKCKKIIKTFDTHVRLSVEMVNGASTDQRYCSMCCLDPALAVLFSDVLSQPVLKMVVRKVWG